MKPANVSAAPQHASLLGDETSGWRDRAGRLYAEFERPARLMVRRAFRGAFSDDEIEDIYASAWVGTLRTLAHRHQRLGDEEIRSYLLTAVANQAGKELRRRRRKPTAPLDLVGGIADQGATPDERAAGAERTRVARDLLTSLPPRRRAVMLLRYGWGLEPAQVCGLVKGLSPRAYRKEVTRGVAEMTEKMRTLERGEWCAEREPVLRAYASGLANGDQERQAEAHLAHCRDCARFVRRLRGHLHEIGSAAALPATIDGIDGQRSVAENASDLGERLRDGIASLLSRRGAGAEEAAGPIAAGGGARGAGAAGAGVLAKLAGLGTAGKLAVTCLGGGVAATACIAAGLAPLGSPPSSDKSNHAGEPAKQRSRVGATATPVPAFLPSQPEDESSASAAPGPTAPSEGPPSSTPSDTTPDEPLAPSTPPAQREFGVAAAAPAPPSPAPTASASSDGGGSPVEQEFGP